MTTKKKRTKKLRRKLASLHYTGKTVVNINNNNPNFSKQDLDTSHGAWQKYGDLDSQNWCNSIPNII